MRILNIRRGFATNSSSTHSIIIHKGNLEDDYDSDGFAWENFVAKSKEAKTRYFAMSLHDSLSYDMTEDETAKIIQKYFPGFNDYDDYDDDYVDHQSRFLVPRYLNGEYALDFYKTFADNIINNDDLAIVGGNDNDDGPNIFSDYETIDTYFKPETSYRVRREKYGWILFDPIYGTKLRIGKDSRIVDDYDSYVPELVDLKITDYCDKNCAFCYQNSHENGEHASLDDITRILIGLRDLGVFEVAIGGGEPIFHPDMIEILELCKKYRITPNITTANYEWLKYPPFYNIIQKNVGAIGISIEDIDDLKTLKSIKHLSDHHFHYIIGMRPLKEFEEMLSYMDSHFPYATLVLLGYKKLGRGNDFDPFEYKEDWIKTAQEYKRVNIGVDTKIAQDYKHLLDDNNIDPRTYYQSEGVYSKYIDAVNKTVAESSYCGKAKNFLVNKYSWINEKSVERMKELLIARA